MTAFGCRPFLINVLLANGIITSCIIPATRPPGIFSRNFLFREMGSYELVPARSTTFHLFGQSNKKYPKVFTERVDEDILGVRVVVRVMRTLFVIFL